MSDRAHMVGLLEALIIGGRQVRLLIGFVKKEHPPQVEKYITLMRVTLVMSEQYVTISLKPWYKGFSC